MYVSGIQEILIDELMNDIIYNNNNNNNNNS